METKSLMRWIWTVELWLHMSKEFTSLEEYKSELKNLHAWDGPFRGNEFTSGGLVRDIIEEFDNEILLNNWVIDVGVSWAKSLDRSLVLGAWVGDNHLRTIIGASTIMRMWQYLTEDESLSQDLAVAFVKDIGLSIDADDLGDRISKSPVRFKKATKQAAPALVALEIFLEVLVTDYVSRPKEGKEDGRTGKD